MNIAVFLASSSGKNPDFKRQTQALGTWLGKNKHCLVYGGSKNGLMGDLAQSTHEAGGQVLGIFPQSLEDIEEKSPFLDQIIKVKDIPQRISKMIEVSEAFIALPGGIGTLEEMTRVLSLVRLGEIRGPSIFINIDHYYDDLENFFKRMVDEGFINEEAFKDLHFIESIEALSRILQVSEI